MGAHDALMAAAKGVAKKKLAKRKRKSTKSKSAGPSMHKAKKMLEDNSAQSHPLTGKQKHFFGWIAGGRKPRAK